MIFTNNGPTQKSFCLLIILGFLLPSGAGAASATAEELKNRGNLHFNRGDLKKAVSDYSHAISLSPSYAEAYFNRGLAHFKLKLYYKAIVDFDRVIGITPGDRDAYYSRGLAYERTGQIKLAMMDIKKAVEMGDRDSANHLGHLKKLMEKDKKKQRAIDELIKEEEPYGRQTLTTDKNNEYGGGTVTIIHRRGDPAYDGREGIFREIRFYDGNDRLRREEIYHTAAFNAGNGRNKTVIWYDTALNMEKKEFYYTGKMLDVIGVHYYNSQGDLTQKILRNKHGKIIKKR